MTNVAIIRVGRDQHRIAWGGVTLLKEIDGWKVIPYVVHVSGQFSETSIITLALAHRMPLGTIKHAQLAAIAHNREVVARYRAKSKLPSTFQSLSLFILDSGFLHLATYQDSYTQFLEASEREIGALQD